MTLRCVKPASGGRISTECLLHGLSAMVYCKKHPQMRFCSKCENDCMFCNRCWEYRQVKPVPKRAIAMHRTRPARQESK